MRSLKKFWRLRFNNNKGERNASKAKNHGSEDNKTFPCYSFAHKPKQRLSLTGWRLLAHITRTSNAAGTEQAQDINLEEDIQERIDFLACLFGSRNIK